MQNTTIAQPGHAASSARSSQCNAVIFSAGRRPSVGNFWSYSELLKLLKPDPMLITRSVKCLSIPHKIRKRIEYTRQRHAKCQNMFECAINRHKIRIVDSIWILIPVQRQRCYESVISRGASFIAPSSRNVVSSEHNQSAGDTDGPGPGARGCYGQIWYITWPFYTLRPSYIRVRF